MECLTHLFCRGRDCGGFQTAGSLGSEHGVHTGPPLDVPRTGQRPHKLSTSALPSELSATFVMKGMIGENSVHENRRGWVLSISVSSCAPEA